MQQKTPEELANFSLYGMHVRVIARDTDAGVKQKVVLSQKEKVSGDREKIHSFAISLDRLFVLAEKLAPFYFNPHEYPKPHKKPEERAHFIFNGMHVQVIARQADSGLKQGVVVSKHAQTPNGGAKTEKLAIGLDRLFGILEKLNPFYSKRHEEVTPPKTAVKEWWPVAHAHQLLQTGAIVKVVKSFSSRDEAELFASKARHRFVFPQSFRDERLKGEKLVVAGGENPQIDSNLQEARLHLEFHRKAREKALAEAKLKEEVRTLNTSFIPSERESVYVVRPRRSGDGDKQAALIERTREDGSRHQVLLYTRPVRELDGTIRITTTEYDAEKLRAVYRANLELEQRQHAQQMPEQLSSPLHPKQAQNQLQTPANSETKETLKRPGTLDIPHGIPSQDNRYFVLGIWTGNRPPCKGEWVAFPVNVGDPAQRPISPLRNEGREATEPKPSSVIQYVAVKRVSETRGYGCVEGATKNLAFGIQKTEALNNRAEGLQRYLARLQEERQLREEQRRAQRNGFERGHSISL
jgi:hypothetical protein